MTKKSGPIGWVSNRGLDFWYYVGWAWLMFALLIIYPWSYRYGCLQYLTGPAPLKAPIRAFYAPLTWLCEHCESLRNWLPGAEPFHRTILAERNAIEKEKMPIGLTDEQKRRTFHESHATRIDDGSE
jgi:hypothetical protein